MKKNITKSVCLLLALTFVFSFVTACSNDNSQDDETTFAEGADVSMGDSAVEPTGEIVDVDATDMTVGDVSVTGEPGAADSSLTTGKSSTTANVLSGTTTKRSVLSTTKAGEVTTARKGIVAGTAAGATTTKKADAAKVTTTAKSTTTNASGETTTKAAETTTAFTPAYSDSDWSSGGQISKPDVTYYDKYVKAVLDSGNYTVTGGIEMPDEFKNDPEAQKVFKLMDNVSFTWYRSGNKQCAEVGSVLRVLTAGGKTYMMYPLGKKYVDLTEDSDISDAVGSGAEVVGAIDEIFGEDGDMAYQGVESRNGETVEIYKKGDTLIYMHFKGSKLVGIETAVKNNGSVETNVMTFELTSGVNDSSVFKTPQELNYKKVDADEFANLFG